MRSAFRYSTGPSVREHVTDRVEITTEVDGDEDELLGGDLSQDVRGVRLLVEIDTLHVEAGDVEPAKVYLDLLNGETIEFAPDASAIATRIEVVPDLRHRMTLRAVRQGTIRPRARLRFKSRALLAPDHVFLVALKAASPPA